MRTGTIYLKNNKIPVFVALSEEEQTRGLMFVDPPLPAMVFPYSSPRLNKFWMNNVKAPLDIIFCCSGKIINICYGETNSKHLVGDNQVSDFVVELPSGTSTKMGLVVGDIIKADLPKDAIIKIFSDKFELNS